MTIGDSEPVVVVDDNGLAKMKWLYHQREEIFEIENDKKIEEVIKNPKPPKIRHIFTLKDEGMWQCKKCGAMIQSNPEQPLECYEDQGGCARPSSFTAITQIIDPQWFKITKWEDVDVNIETLYEDILAIMKKTVAFPEDMIYKIYTLFLIGTWKIESWNSVPFFIFRGMPDSGKTRAMELGYYLGYRMHNSVNTTFPAICRLSHFRNCGICVDESDTNLKIDTEDGRNFLKFVKNSYRRGSVYTVANKEKQEETISYKNFGPKIFACEKAFDVALLSRSFVIDMEKDYPEITELRYVEKDLEKIRTRLLNYRFKTDAPPDLGQDFVLRGRKREVYECVISTAMHLGVEHKDIIEYAKEQEIEEAEELKNSIEWEILNAISQLMSRQTLLEADAPEMIPLTDIFSNTSWGEVDDSKEQHKMRQRMGYKIKKMALKTKRTKTGTVLCATNPKTMRRLKYLWKRYGV